MKALPRFYDCSVVVVAVVVVVVVARRRTRERERGGNVNPTLSKMFFGWQDVLQQNFG